MQRDLLSELELWRQSKRRKPLLLRGARQVGKSWLVRKFGEQFQHYIELNFETKKQHREIFSDDLAIDKILERIRFIANTPITEGKTLLFLDEIQMCESALRALRYFKEELPGLHVVAAGSLLDFTLDKIGLPVGRVQFLYLHPLSFSEFLSASGRDDLRTYIAQGEVDTVIHHKLLEEVKTYFYLGGMPEVVTSWLDNHDVNECIDVQDELILSYKQDIPKYAKNNRIEFVENLFDAVPDQLGDKFIYNKVLPDVRSYILKEALLCLQKAGLAHIAHHSDAQGLPLGAQTSARRFKVFGFDIGIIQRLLGLSPRDWLGKPMSVKHIGSIAEQFVAQEYIAYTAIKNPSDLYYWHREEKRSNAEVDFVFIKDSLIVPVEVKASSKGHLKSMHLFLESHPHSTFGIKVSEAPYQRNSKITSIPFYMLEAWLKGMVN